jgi:pyridoxine 5-phosphate synthase
MNYTKLSVNINKFALVRNARGYLPDIISLALDCERFGADGITVHPRPDERHITRKDVMDLKQSITTELNVEGYPSCEFLELISNVKPHQVTLVPDAPDQITSDHGWDIATHFEFLKTTISTLKKNGCKVSLFVDTNIENIKLATQINADTIELYTGPYAQQPETTILSYANAASYAHSLGLNVNAGHDLNLNNLALLKKHLPQLNEVSIGHALVCDAWIYGLDNTINMYKRLLD